MGVRNRARCIFKWESYRSATEIRRFVVNFVSEKSPLIPRQNSASQRASNPVLGEPGGKHSEMDLRDQLRQARERGDLNLSQYLQELDKLHADAPRSRSRSVSPPSPLSVVFAKPESLPL